MNCPRCGRYLCVSDCPNAPAPSERTYTEAQIRAVFGDLTHRGVTGELVIQTLRDLYP